MSPDEGIDSGTTHLWAREITRGCETPHRLDHACSDCVPGGSMVEIGFSCVFHQAYDFLRYGINPSKPPGGTSR